MCFLKKIMYRTVEIHPLTLLIPAILLMLSLFIRTFYGSTILIYGMVGYTGLFPGPFIYTLFYFVRLIMSGIVFSLSLITDNMVGRRIAASLISLSACISILLEYNLVFIKLRLVTALVLSAVVCILYFILLIMNTGRNRGIRYSARVLCAFQLIFCVQLLSLMMHI